MNNPLKLFHNLLFNGDALNPFAAITVGDEKLSLFDGDITDRIVKETGKVFIVIDDVYWNGNKSENDYFFTKLLNITRKLLGEASSQLEKHLEHLVIKQDLSSWLATYNNTQCVYENLMSIRSRVLDYYCDGSVVPEDKAEHQKRYPLLLPESAAALREVCVANVGKRDTEFTERTANEVFCNVVATAKMSPVAVELSVSPASIPYADHVYVHGSQPLTQASTAILIWSGTPKEFVQRIYPLVASKKLFIGDSSNRTPIVGALHGIFHISATDNATKEKKRISEASLQTYFKKEASGDVY